MTEETQETDVQKQISFGLQPHPITSEMGLSLSIDETDTWLSFSAAKRLTGEIDISITTGIALGTLTNLMQRMSGPSDDGLIVP